MTDKEMVIHLAGRAKYNIHFVKIDSWYYPFYNHCFVSPHYIHIGLHEGQVNYKFDDAGQLISISSQGE